MLRWHIEGCYKRLKVGAELENFSGEAVLQEFWANLVMCNILSLHICDAQGPWNPDQITEYRLNFSVLFSVMRQKLYQVLIAPKNFQALFKYLSCGLANEVKLRNAGLFRLHGI